MIPFIMRTTKMAFVNLRTNREVSMVTVVIITVALSILGLFFLMFLNLDAILEAWNRQVRLVVYLNDDINREEQRTLEDIIGQNPDVAFSEFVPREKAWDNFKKSFAGKAEVIKNLDFNPLPSSLVLQFRFGPKRFEKIQKFAGKLKSKKGVESLEYGEKWLSRFESFMIFMQVFLMAVGGLLGVGLILIISNAIKLSIYSRKQEVELMMMMGARIQFIKGPFLIEGTLQALIGGVLSILIVKGFFYYMRFHFEGVLDFLLRGITLEFFSIPGVIIIVIVSMAIGLLGSWLSIHYFLRSEFNI